VLFRSDQVWVAGGIGITPFIAYLRNNQIDQSVEMFYSYRGDAGGVYKDFLENYQKNNKQFKVNLIDTDIMKPLDLKDYPLKKDSSVFMCGPAEMVENYVRIFRKKNKNVDLTFEAFKLR
jgi:predicted ferric reductase